MTNSFIDKLDELVKANPQYTTYRVMIEDNKDRCECPECSKPIKLPNGKILNPNDKNFYSTRFFIWLNKIAGYMQRNYPEKRILTFAYYFTEVPPAVKVAPNIDISFCPIFKNSKFPMNAPQNAKVNKAFRNWLQNTRNITLREYFGLTGSVPRPVDAIALADWRYANKNGVVKTYSEICSDEPTIKHWGESSWDANAIYFWVMANATWNPCKYVKEYRKEFLNRVFGPAARDMEEYYSLLEKEWLKNPAQSTCDDDATSVWKYILSPGIKKKCQTILERAETKIIHPNRKKMFQRVKNNFLNAQEITKEIYLQAYKANKKPVFDPNFNSGEWTECRAETRFLLHPGDKPYKSNTEVKILYNSKNIFFGIKCSHSTPAKMPFRKLNKGKNIFPNGEGFEIFISANWRKRPGYVQVVVDPSNNRYWSFCGDKAWEGKWYSEAKVTKTGWSAMITIPWEELGIDINKKVSIKCALIRQINRCSPPSAPAVAVHLFGTSRHRVGTFAELKLKK